MDQRQKLRNISEQSLYFFTREIMDYKAVHAPLHEEIVCPFLTDWEGDKFIKLLLIPREHLKSTIASISFPNWLWSIQHPEKKNFPCGPETRILLSHGKRELACTYVRETKNHHTSNDVFRYVCDDIVFDEPHKQAPLWREDQIVVRREGGPGWGVLYLFLVPPLPVTKI